MYKILLAITAVVTLALVPGTIAYLSDAETAGNNTFQAGTFDLSLAENQPQDADAFGNINWAPGMEFEGSIGLRNDGSLPIESLTMQARTEISE